MAIDAVEEVGLKYDAGKVRWDLLQCGVLASLQHNTSVYQPFIDTVLPANRAAAALRELEGYKTSMPMGSLSACRYLHAAFILSMLMTYGSIDEHAWIKAKRGIAKVLTFGAAKYKDNSWQNVPNCRARYYSAACRHIDAVECGKTYDEESGLPHIEHAMCNIMFLLSYEFGFDELLPQVKEVA